MSAFMGLSPNKDLKNLIRAESVFLALYMIYIMLYIMPGTLTPPHRSAQIDTPIYLQAALLGAYHRVPTTQGKQGKQGKWPKKIMSGKTQGIWKFCQNTGKTQGILFAQVVNSLMPKVKDIAKISIFSQKLDRSAKSVLCM